MCHGFGDPYGIQRRPTSGSPFQRWCLSFKPPLPPSSQGSWKWPSTSGIFTCYTAGRTRAIPVLLAHLKHEPLRQTIDEFGRFRHISARPALKKWPATSQLLHFYDLNSLVALNRVDSLGEIRISLWGTSSLGFTTRW